MKTTRLLRAALRLTALVATSVALAQPAATPETTAQSPPENKPPTSTVSIAATAAAELLVKCEGGPSGAHRYRPPENGV